MIHRLISVALLLTMLLGATVKNVYGETENQRFKQAEKLFLAKQYAQAMPLFGQLVSSSPKSYKYNYYYGICLLIAGKDKSQAMPYLETAMQSPKTPEDIYYYMGRALHLNYHFDEAMRSYTEFNSIIGVKNVSRWHTPEQMEMCNNAKKILDTTKNSAILERTEALAGEFYGKYEFTSGNGKLLSMPDQLIETSHSDKDESPTIFLSANGRVMYYSSVNPLSNSRDIFRVEKDLDNNWSEPTCISAMVNTPQDELFPSCNPDGRILYFSSRGHNSTGGFDIFKAYYNTVSKTWSEPVNMGSPYNSPDDDFCFVASTQDQVAYFTSQRETGPGSFTVYKSHYSNTEELPIAINGRFNCIGQPDLKEVKLTISRDGEQNIVAELSTDKTNGNYILELPGPGTYAFKVEAPGFQPHSQNVTFAEYSDNIMVQDIFLSRDLNSNEDLAIATRKLTESGSVDGTATAGVDENGNMTSGITLAEVKNAMSASEAVEALMGRSMGGRDEKSMVDRAEAGASIDTQASATSSLNNAMNAYNQQGIHFKVQIGAFRKHQREMVQKRLERKTDKTMMSSYDDLTWLRFFMGGEANYKSAKNLRNTLQQAGFGDAFVVAFKDGKPMNLVQAIQQSK